MRHVMVIVPIMIRIVMVLRIRGRGLGRRNRVMRMRLVQEMKGNVIEVKRKNSRDEQTQPPTRLGGRAALVLLAACGHYNVATIRLRRAPRPSLI